MTLLQRIANAFQKLANHNSNPYDIDIESIETIPLDYDKFNHHDVIDRIAEQFRMDGKADIARALQPKESFFRCTVNPQFTAEDELILQIYELSENARKLGLPFVVAIRMDEYSHVLMDTPEGTPREFYNAIHTLIGSQYE